MIYLDNAATTRMTEEVLNTFVDASRNIYFNPSSIYSGGIEASKQIKLCKEKICSFLGVAFQNNIIFTGSATEANNLAVLGAFKKSFKNILCSIGEHPSVYNAFKRLEEQGASVNYIPLQKNGEIDYEWLDLFLRKEKVDFISVMLVNSETGVINDLKKVHKLLNVYSQKAIFHTDAVQGFGKFSFNVLDLGVDMVTISAHKINGPKGLGALWVKDTKLLKPIYFGGGQEYNLRSGTQNCPSIIAFKKRLDTLDIVKNFNEIKNIKKTFLHNLEDITNQYSINATENVSPYILSIYFPKVNAETLVHILDNKGIYISTGSACSSKKAGNRVLEAMGIPKERVTGSVRISFGCDTKESEVRIASQQVGEAYNELKGKLGV